MEAFLAPVLLTVGIAGVAAVMLALAAKFLAVPENEEAVAIRECLSGANCGACGFAGCDDYAKALSEDHSIATNLCVPGGAGAATKIAAILGMEAMDVSAKVAVIHCSGINDVTKEAMEYQGLKSCFAVKGFFGGPNECKFGCIGFGDCEKACPNNAISICEGIAKIDRDACVGCGICAKTCPQHLIEIVPLKSRVVVGCDSCDKGKDTKNLCERGCIGCKLCEKECPFDAIHVENNHAVIDYSKCKACGKCAKVCPRHIINVFPKAPAPVKAEKPAEEAGETK